MLVPDIHHATSLLGQARGPIHVGIPEQCKACSHAFLREGLGEDVVQAGLDFVLHRRKFSIGGEAPHGRPKALAPSVMEGVAMAAKRTSLGVDNMLAAAVREAL